MQRLGRLNSVLIGLSKKLSILPRKCQDMKNGTHLGCLNSLALNISWAQEEFEVNLMKWNI